jgi:hypothetical protein
MMSSPTFAGPETVEGFVPIASPEGVEPAPPPTHQDAQLSQKSPQDSVPILPTATKKERFFLIAADQESGSRDERLSRVIHSKYEAGLLKPYNYVKGYQRLSHWMDRK